ncbi:MAG TPA: hypothetical protein PLN01_05055 [Spirochaetota bacterium]|nr:hypothetical protein [Spirochaetota bacterium]
MLNHSLSSEQAHLRIDCLTSNHESEFRITIAKNFYSFTLLHCSNPQ